MHGHITRNGFKLDYIIEGTGPSLLIMGDNPYYQKVFSQNLREHFQIVFAKHKGFVPPSANTDKSVYAIDAIIDDFEAMRQQLKIDKWIVLGHSGNAYFALEYAKKYPQQTSGVVMVGIAPDLSPENTTFGLEHWQSIASDERKQALATSLKKNPDTSLADLAASDYFIADYVRKTPRIWYDYNFDALPLFSDSYFNVDMISYVWGELFATIDLAENANNFDIPIWVALGKYDSLVAPLASWKELQQCFPTMEITVFDKYGHTPQYEEAERFDIDLIAWSKKCN